MYLKVGMLCCFLTKWCGGVCGYWVLKTLGSSNLKVLISAEITQSALLFGALIQDYPKLDR